MKILFLVFTFAISNPSFATLTIKKGLWNVETKMKMDGKEFDPQAEVKAAMANMPPEQRAQMQAMMAKMNPGGGPAMGMNDKGMQVCFTEEMIKNEESLNQHKNKDCESSFPVKTPSRVVSNFKCKDGTSGTAEWNIKDSSHYEGTVKIQGGRSGNSEIKYQASFISTDCGKLSTKK